MSVEQVIIQIGDLHFPEFVAKKTAVDTHDAKAPGALENHLGLPVTAALKNALMGQLKLHPEALVAICGDVTSRGDRASFEAGLRYLAEAVRGPGIEPPLPDDRIHLVPGNHDIAFKSDAPFESFDDVKRFEDLARIADKVGFNGIYTIDHRITRLTNSSGGALSVLSVNTCRGAGATRLDATERGRQAGYVDDHDTSQISSPSDSRDAEKLLGEVLDVPLLHPEELRALASEWESIDWRIFPVILAHHGLLPQHTPRLNPYTEMVNAGQARKALANLHRPVLYLHGHIHEHVVEVIDSPKPGDPSAANDRTVVVAAPELKDGFNKIIVEFNDQGRAVGLTVEQWRIRHGEQSVHREPNDVRIMLSKSAVSNAGRRAVLGHLAQTRLANGAELVDHGSRSSPPLSASEVQAAVESLVWAGTIARVSQNEPTFEESGFAI